MKRTFAVASRRACLRVVLIAWPPRLLVPRRPSSRPHPYLNHPLTRAPPFRPLFLRPAPARPRLAVSRDIAFFDKLDHAIVRTTDGYSG